MSTVIALALVRNTKGMTGRKLENEMWKFIFTAMTVAATFVAIVSMDITPLRAGANWPICANTYDKGGSDLRCDYVSFAQCQASLLGLPGSCVANPYLPASNDDKPQRRRQR